MKRIGEEIEVRTVRDRPVAFRWRRRHYTVRETIDTWILQGKWWVREERRVYFKVLTDRGTMEIFHRDDRWWLSSIYD